MFNISNNHHENLVLSVKEKIENGPHEIMVGSGDRRFMLLMEENSRVVHLVDPKTGQKIDLQIHDSTSSNTTVRGRIEELVFESIHENRPEDRRISIVETFDLNRKTITDEVSFRIVNLPEGTIINRIEIIIDEPFSNVDHTQHNISVEGENGEVLMPESWSDPNESGCYSSSLNYVVGPSGFIRVVHDLNHTISGSGSLKIHEYRPEASMIDVKRTVG